MMHATIDKRNELNTFKWWLKYTSIVFQIPLIIKLRIEEKNKWNHFLCMYKCAEDLVCLRVHVVLCWILNHKLKRQQRSHREKMLKEVFVVLEVSEEPIVLMRQQCCTCQEMIRCIQVRVTADTIKVQCAAVVLTESTQTPQPTRNSETFWNKGILSCSLKWLVRTQKPWLFSSRAVCYLLILHKLMFICMSVWYSLKTWRKYSLNIFRVE